MAKVYGLVPAELRAGVTGDAFERLWLNEYAPIGLRVDWNARLWKADRGQRTGKYMAMWEIPSIEARDRIAPEPGKVSEEGLRLLGPEFRPLGEKLGSIVMEWPSTDYIELGANPAQTELSQGIKHDVILIADIELKPGAGGDGFERLWLEYAVCAERIRCVPHLLKADRGVRLDQYAVMWDVPSIEWRDHLLTGPGTLSEEGLRLIGPEYVAMSARFQDFLIRWNWTDYLRVDG